ncbi:putative ribonuclease H-like domain-containing protein [Tanacetum coccineum]
MYSFFVNQPSSPQLDDPNDISNDHDDLKKWTNAGGQAFYEVLIKLRLNALTVTKGAILQGNVKHQEIKGTGIEMQGIGVGTTPEAQDEPTDFALMAYTLNSLGSDTEANLEIIAYQLGLESVEAQLVVHQKNEALDETLREKDDLKAKLEQFETSSKNLNKLINSQLSSKDKTGLGYGDQLNENDSSGSELFNSVFDSRSSDGDDNQTNDRFKKDNGYHAVPPPLTGNYMPPLADLSFAGLDDSVYRPTTNKTSASVSQVEKSTSQTSNTNVEMPRVESVRPSGVIIEDWVSDDEDIFQSNDLQATDKPSFKRIEFTNARNESVKPKQAEKPRIITQNPKLVLPSKALSEHSSINWEIHNSFEEQRIILSLDVLAHDREQRLPYDYKDFDGDFVCLGGSFDLRNVVPYGDLTCLFANAIIDESKLWHRRWRVCDFKTMNKLVKGNLIRGLPSKIFVNDHTCVACQKGK